MVNFIKGKSSALIVQIFRYLVSGVTAFVVDFSALWFFTEIVNLHYLLSTVIANSIGLVITYLFSIFWIFDSRRVKNTEYEFLIFILIGVLGILLTMFFMWLITDVLAVQYLISKVFTVVIVAVISFILKKLILF